jgi:hypothetical protein
MPVAAMDGRVNRGQVRPGAEHQAGETRPAKEHKKIDPMVAATMAVGVMGRLVPKGNLEDIMENLLVL